MPRKNLPYRVAAAGIGALLMIATLFVATPGIVHASDLTAARAAPNCYASSVHCQIGDKMSGGPSNYDYYTYIQSSNLVVFVRKLGDIVYVYDNNPDGKSAVAEIKRMDGSGITRVCRNRSGYRTYVQCNFNWTEDCAYVIYGWTFNQYNSYDTWSGRWGELGMIGNFSDGSDVC